MPTYGFVCLNPECAAKVDLCMSISEYDPADVYYCDKCGAALKRVIDSANFQLIGDGWFKDGY